VLFKVILYDGAAAVFSIASTPEFKGNIVIARGRCLKNVRAMGPGWRIGYVLSVRKKLSALVQKTAESLQLSNPASVIAEGRVWKAVTGPQGLSAANA
jgi:hypothetical protein